MIKKHNKDKSSENNNIFLETPIDKIEDDKFGCVSYSKQIVSAFEKGAKFIAIDGEYGVGKSSILNLTKKLIEDKNKYKIFNHFRQKKDYFVNINFLNINNVSTEESDKINNYHRYFVNQTANDLYRNPYDIEKLFYHNFVSYSTISLKNDNLFKKIIDKALLILLAFISLYLIYSSFFKNFELLKGLYNFSTEIMPYILFTLFILLILYGYGFYKPDKSEISPMLEVDKCRNNLCKILFNKIPKNSNVYFILDDLDRLENNLQLQIISLLYNEYFPLDKIIKDINLKFIFMINISELNKLNKLNESDKSNEPNELKKLNAPKKSNNNNNINVNKLFDYIINISNNQITILRNYLIRNIENNTILEKLFDIKEKDYIIGLILNNYNSIRKIKHFLNRVITKYIYLTNKNYKDLNNAQLICICILINLTDTETLNNNINNIIHNYNYSLEKNDEDENILNIIKELYERKLIDNNYYVYLYNFIDIDDLLNNDEQFIYNILNNLSKLKEDDLIKMYEILDGNYVSFSKIYNEIYKYVSNNSKILLLGNKTFNSFMESNYQIDYEIFKNLYRNPFIYFCYEFLNNKYYYAMDDEIELLEKYFQNFEQQSSIVSNKEKDDFVNELKIFIKNMKYNIKFFNFQKYFNWLELDKNLFTLIYNQKEKKVSVIYEMILNEKLSWDIIEDFVNESIINDILSIQDDEFRLQIEECYLKWSKSFDFMIQIIYKEKRIINDIEEIFTKLNQFEDNKIDLETLKTIINKYGYLKIFDKYLINNLKENENDTICYINENKFDISENIINAINESNYAHKFKEHYNNLFLKYKYYKIYIYSKAKKNKTFDINIKLKSNEKYIHSLLEIFESLNTDWKNYNFTDNFKSLIIKEINIDTIELTDKDFWKILKLIPQINNHNESFKFFNRIRNLNLLDKFCSYCSRNCNDKDFINNLNLFVSEFGTTGNKIVITKLKNKIEEKQK